jgi:PEGA domain
VFDHRAELRVQATPKDAAVYVDGFYAGIVDDFDGIFQPLFLPPGEHQIALYLEGFRTIFHNVYLRPGSSLKLHDRLDRLPPGARSVPPEVAPPLPPPPHGTYDPPRTPPPVPAPAPGPVRPAAGFGTLEVRVQPVDAIVTVNGERWLSSDEGRYVLQVAPGNHRVEVTLEGHQPFSMDVEVKEGEAAPLNVSLAAIGKK